LRRENLFFRIGFTTPLRLSYPRRDRGAYDSAVLPENDIFHAREKQDYHEGLPQLRGGEPIKV
jgi:hypothetical protein